ncbi:condensation domain-containing protein [Amycolatopsis sp. NPDC051903]|uniref:condensation domain-containing protein n=1 Tax=Amycolatopsis sp. NPDC051903 TaxID=3363936 RepID=UPI0037ABC9B8
MVIVSELVNSESGATSSSVPAELLRPLGAFERLYHRYQEKSTMHFSVVAELAQDLEPAALESALRQVQQRHPLLNVQVEEHPPGRLGFYRPLTVPPIPLTVVEPRKGQTWRDVVAEELTRPVDTSRAPMVRVTLLRAGSGAAAAIVLTVAHVIVDGLSAGFIMRDLFSVLNGHELAALSVPPSQEDLIGGLGTVELSTSAVAGTPEREPEWSAASGAVRPFDGTRPEVSSVDFGVDLTQRLIARSRFEGTTVHSALVAAMSTVIIDSGRNEFVRVLSPFSFRSHIGVTDEVCLYFTATRTAFRRGQVTGLWSMARAIGRQLAVARSAANVRAISAATERFIGVDATTQDAAAFLLGGLSYEAFASNLGVLELAPFDVAVRPVAFWGPAILCQVDGELATGISTYDGRLRMVSASYDPLSGYLERVRDVVDEASQPFRNERC